MFHLLAEIGGEVQNLTTGQKACYCLVWQSSQLGANIFEPYHSTKQLHLSQHKANTVTPLNLSMHQHITCTYIQQYSLYMNVNLDHQEEEGGIYVVQITSTAASLQIRGQ